MPRRSRSTPSRSVRDCVSRTRSTIGRSQRASTSRGAIPSGSQRRSTALSKATAERPPSSMRPGLSPAPGGRSTLQARRARRCGAWAPFHRRCTRTSRPRRHASRRARRGRSSARPRGPSMARERVALQGSPVTRRRPGAGSTVVAGSGRAASVAGPSRSTAPPQGQVPRGPVLGERPGAGRPERRSGASEQGPATPFAARRDPSSRLPKLPQVSQGQEQAPWSSRRIRDGLGCTLARLPCKV